MRLQVSVALLIVVMGASSVSAGRLFGDVKMGGKPAPEALLITLQAVAKPEKAKTEPAPPDSVRTDKLGSYKIMAKNDGKYTLTVHLGKQTAALEVFSYKEPTRYDLILEEADGKLSVRRK